MCIPVHGKECVVQPVSSKQYDGWAVGAAKGAWGEYVGTRVSVTSMTRTSDTLSHRAGVGTDGVGCHFDKEAQGWVRGCFAGLPKMFLKNEKQGFYRV